jgi:hypothetical protein
MTRHERTPNLGRHKRNCSVCCHLKLAEIEADFISWRSPAAIAQDYGLADGTSVYRHAHTLGHFPSVTFAAQEENSLSSRDWRKR